MLKEAAANAWKVPVAEVSVDKGVITHKASNRSTTYGKVAEAAAKLEPPKEVKLKDPKDWKIAGKPLKRFDVPDKVTGATQYSMDFKMPGMLCAAVKECPVFGGKLKSFDAAKVTGMPGVKKVVRSGDAAVAVVADTWWQAKTALEALPIVWDEGENAKVSSASIAAWLKEGLDADSKFVGNKQGDINAAIAGAAKKVEAVYSYPYQNHATMEPMNATALYTPDKCQVWTSSQNAEAAFGATVQASGLPAAKCDVINTFLGGGFGRRARSEYVAHAVRVAKEMPGTPIKLIKSREDDMANGVYHPITQCKLIGTLDKDNNLTGLRMRISGQSILASVRPEALDKETGKDPFAFQGLNPGGAEGAFGYTIPNLLIDHAMRNPHVPPWFWRGVNNNQNAIYLECFMDELAHAAGQDPLEFRRKLMKNHPKHLAVLNAVAERAGWGKPARTGRVPRHLPAHGLRQLRRGLCGGFGQQQRGEDSPHRRGDRLRPRRQPGLDRAPSPRLVRLRAFGVVLWRLHRQGRPHRTDQLRYLQFDAHFRNAEGRDDRDAVRRLLGRRRRADDLRRRAGRAQCDLRGDRQAHSDRPSARSRPASGLSKVPATARAGRRRLFPSI